MGEIPGPSEERELSPEELKLRADEWMGDDLKRVAKAEMRLRGLEPMPEVPAGASVEATDDYTTSNLEQHREEIKAGLSAEVHRENKRMDEELKKDRLTRLPNDRALVGAILRLAKEAGITLTNEQYKNTEIPGYRMAKFDLSGLKAVNDKVSPNDGDLLIKRAADTLRGVGVREEFKIPERSIFRAGERADEFYVICPATVVKNFVETVEAEFEASTGVYHVSGGELKPSLPGDMGTTISEVDEALNLKKHSGESTDARVTGVFTKDPEIE